MRYQYPPFKTHLWGLHNNSNRTTKHGGVNIQDWRLYILILVSQPKRFIVWNWNKIENQYVFWFLHCIPVGWVVHFFILLIYQQAVKGTQFKFSSWTWVEFVASMASSLSLLTWTKPRVWPTAASPLIRIYHCDSVSFTY